MRLTKKMSISLISILLLGGLITIVIKGLDLLGYEGQLINFYHHPVSDALEIKGDLAIGQTFLAPVDGLQRIDVVLRTYGRRNTHDVTFYLKQSLDSPEVIYQETFDASEIRNNSWRTFEFPPIPDSAGRTFFFYFASPDSVKGDAITVGGALGDLYNGGNAYLGPVPADADMAFRTYYGLSPSEKLAILGERLVENKPSVWSDIRFYLLLAGLYALILLLAFVELIRLAQRE
jgi:hypothetical protein